MVLLNSYGVPDPFFFQRGNIMGADRTKRMVDAMSLNIEHLIVLLYLHYFTGHVNALHLLWTSFVSRSTELLILQ